MENRPRGVWVHPIRKRVKIWIDPHFEIEASAPSYCSSLWVIIMPILAHRFGRKRGLILVNLSVLLGNLLFYLSNGVTLLLFALALQGISAGSIIILAVMVLTEYTSPRYRGLISTMNAATFFWGVWVSNAIGTFFHWKNICIVVLVCGIYNLISSILSFESPYWLATKGRFDECEKVHRWLKGTDDDSIKELRKLIISQQEKLSNKPKLNGHILKLEKYVKIIRRRNFYKPLLYSFLLVVFYNVTGKMACTVYAIDIISKITSSERMAYQGMLILDAVTVLGMYLGCVLSKIVKRRKQMLGFSSLGIAFLYCLSIYLYVVKLGLVFENHYISLVFLLGFSLSISCGPIVVAPCCSAELAPLRNRGYFLCCITFTDNICLAVTLNISPFLFKYCGSCGAFLCFAVASSVLIFILYKCLPETKDLTIQEIEEYITRGALNNRNAEIVETLPLNEARK